MSKLQQDSIDESSAINSEQERVIGQRELAIRRGDNLSVINASIGTVVFTDNKDH